MIEFEEIVSGFCVDNDISITLSYDMPVGYETAYGTYDVTINTLFLNAQLLQNAPKHEVSASVLNSRRTSPYCDQNSACRIIESSAIMVSASKKRHSQFARLIFGLRAVILIPIL